MLLFKDVESDSVISVVNYLEKKELSCGVNESITYNEIHIQIDEGIGIFLDIETAIKFKKALTHEIQKAKQNANSKSSKI